MKVEKIPVVELELLSKLMRDYIDEKPEINFLYKYKKNIESFKEIIKDKSEQKLDREILFNELNKQYFDIENKEKVTANIALLKDKKTFTITTAHQLCLFTGPLYFIYKTISTIKLCTLLKEEYPDYNFVPIFWLGSEDHDFEEVNHLHLNNKKIEWESSQKGAVGRMKNEGLNLLIFRLNKK